MSKPYRFNIPKEFWYGLAVALCIAALFVPIMFGSNKETETRASIQLECIKQHGNWDDRQDQCTFNAK